MTIMEDEDLLSQITIGTKISIYWPMPDDEWYPAIVAKSRPVPKSLSGNHAYYTINYDDGEVETINLAEEQFRIISIANETTLAKIVGNMNALHL
mmetsp:Transcript_684/g.1403  ORF Transcript_684/g.1403 Transcript_684/m.1403 type:complete len:95 (-) Transcript_684:126-410(-)